MFTASGAAANHAVYRNVMFTGTCQEYRDCHRLGLIRIQGKAVWILYRVQVFLWPLLVS